MRTARLAPLTAQLKAAREKKGLSQRALASRVGLPQGHISRIERGQVDLQASSLVEIARALDLELALVPREMIPAALALMNRSGGGTSRQIPAYRLDDEDDDANS